MLFEFVVSQWVRIVLRYSPICFYMHMRHQELLKNKGRIVAQASSSSFRYIDDVLSLNNYRFGNYLHNIYPNEFEVKDTTDVQQYASYLDLEINNSGGLKTKLYDKRDDPTFPIVNFSFISGNIPAYSSVWSLHFTIQTLF